MLDLEFWKQSEIVVGLVFTAFGAIWGIGKWLEKRGQARVDRTKDDLTRDADTRVGALEMQLTSVAAQVESVAQEVNDIEGRVVGVERTLETVARTENVHALALVLARLEATIKALGGKVDTLYRAAFEAGKQEK